MHLLTSLYLLCDAILSCLLFYIAKCFLNTTGMTSNITSVTPTGTKYCFMCIKAVCNFITIVLKYLHVPC